MKPPKDYRYLSWLHALPCAVAGKGSPCFGRITAHHLMRMGQRKDDRRAIPLCVGHHQRDWGKDSFERLRWKGFEARFGIDLESTVVDLNARYDAERVAA